MNLNVDTCGEIDVTRRVNFNVISVAEPVSQFASGYSTLASLAFRISHLLYSFNTHQHQEMHLDRAGLPLGASRAAGTRVARRASLIARRSSRVATTRVTLLLTPEATASSVISGGDVYCWARRP